MRVFGRIACMIFLTGGAAIAASAQAPNVQEGIWWEPNIAYDPTDATHQTLILGNNGELLISNDGGNTFPYLTYTHNLPDRSTSGGDGTVAFDSKGGLFWMHLENVNTLDLVAVNPSAAGTGYQVGDVLSVVEENAMSGTVQVTSIGPNGSVTELSVVQGGYGYTYGFPTTGGHGSGCDIDVTQISSGGAITNANVDNNKNSAGSGYQIGDLLTVTESGASGGTVEVTSIGANGAVNTVSVVSGGTGYTYGFPTTATTGQGSGCQVTATRIWPWYAAVEQIDEKTGNQAVNPATGQPIPMYEFPNPSLYYDDKPWIAADSNPNSPFRDNVYAVWSRHIDSAPTGTGAFQAYFSKYNPASQSWSTPVSLTPGSSSVMWPTYVTVAPSGDLYISYRACPSDQDPQQCEIQVIHSSDGGTGLANGNIPTPVTAIPAGLDAFNENNGSPPGIPYDTVQAIDPGTTLVPDDKIAGTVYLFTNTTPAQNPTGTMIVMSESQNYGASWSPAPIQIGAAQAQTIQLMPSASTDGNGNVLVKWYDNRDGLTDAAGNSEFNVYATMGSNSGSTWTPAFRINTQPVVVADTYGRNLGEYTASAGQQGTAYTAWRDPNSASLCNPGCFDEFSTASPNFSITALEYGGGCGNAADVQVLVTDANGNPLANQSIQFTTQPGYIIAPSGSATTDANGMAWVQINYPTGNWGPVLVTAVDVSQPAPRNAVQSYVYFSSPLECRLSKILKCVPDLCGFYRLPGFINSMALVGCESGLCDHPGDQGVYRIPVGDNFGPVAVVLRTTNQAEAASLSTQVHVSVFSKGTAAAFLKANPNIVSPEVHGPMTSFVGPVIEVRADARVSRRKLGMKLILPHTGELQPGIRLDVVRLSSSNSNRKWSAEGIQVTQRTRTTISAHVIGPGTYTVIAQRIPEEDELEERYSHGGNPPAKGAKQQTRPQG